MWPCFKTKEGKNRCQNTTGWICPPQDKLLLRKGSLDGSRRKHWHLIDWCSSFNSLGKLSGSDWSLEKAPRGHRKVLESSEVNTCKRNLKFLARSRLVKAASCREQAET